MFTDSEIEAIIKKKIESDEKLGDQSGGSGNMSHSTYELKEYKVKELSQGRIEINYEYTVFVETEFTYYPDNPPYEYPHKQVIIVDSNKVILEEMEIVFDSEPIETIYSEEDWTKAQKDVMIFIEKFLAKIEWEYGENRAPVKYPPEFYELIADNGGLEYCCSIEMDLGDDEKLYYKSQNPFDLVQLIEKDLLERFTTPE